MVGADEDVQDEPETDDREREPFWHARGSTSSRTTGRGTTMHENVEREQSREGRRRPAERNSKAGTDRTSMPATEIQFVTMTKGT